VRPQAKHTREAGVNSRSVVGRGRAALWSSIECAHARLLTRSCAVRVRFARVLSGDSAHQLARSCFYTGVPSRCPVHTGGWWVGLFGAWDSQQIRLGAFHLRGRGQRRDAPAKPASKAGAGSCGRRVRIDANNDDGDSGGGGDDDDRERRAAQAAASRRWRRCYQHYQREQ
jgi:hypothetical protein